MLPLALAFTYILGNILAALIHISAYYWFAAAGFSLLVALSLALLQRRNPAHPLLRPIPLPNLKPAPETPDTQTPDTPYTPPSLSPILLSLSLAALLLGAGRYQSSLPILSNPAFIASYNENEHPYTVIGIIAEPPDLRDNYLNIRVNAEQIRHRDGIQHVDVHGLLLARVDYTDDDWQYGDRITLTGNLLTPPEVEDFSYRDYLARQGVYSYMPRARATLLERGQGSPILSSVYALQQRALQTIHTLFSDPEASLLAGILLGIETGIPDRLDDAFRDTGTSHIVAISGFNISIIAGIFMSLLGRTMGPKLGAFTAVVGITLYTVLVGADAAVVRAALMGGLAIFAKLTGRKQQAALSTLFLTAALMAYANPLILGDVGFQLSFAATLGLVLYADPLQKWAVQTFTRYMRIATAEKIAPYFSEFFLYTLAAQLTTLPLIIYYFQRISFTSFIANPLILPMQPAVMVAGGIATLAGMIWLPLGKMLAPLAWVFVAYTIRVVELMAKIPAGVLVLGSVSLVVVIALYLLLFGLTAARVRAPSLQTAPRQLAVAGVLALLTFVVWRGVQAAPDGRLHLTLLDVGSGDALLIRTPSGRNVLIDGGPSTTALSNALGRRLPPGQRAPDYLIVAAPAEQQVAALPRVIERFPPGKVLWAGPPNASYEARLLRGELTAAQIPIIPAEPGHELPLGEGAVLRILTTGARGAVLLLEWDNFRALLPIGADFDALEDLNYGADLGPVNVLLLADNGYAPLAPPEWIDALRPQLALISVSAADARGMPSPETLTLLAEYPLLRTDQHGWIHLTTDGETMWVEAERR